MKTLIFILLSLGATAQQQERIHGNNQIAKIVRHIEFEDSTYVLTFRDLRFQILTEYESVLIDPEQIKAECETVLETGEIISSNEYTIYRVGKKGLAIYVGEAYFYPTLKFFEKACLKK